MEKRLTYKQAVKYCRDLWRWLEKNPHIKLKELAPILKNKNVLHDCFTCEYVDQQIKFNSGSVPSRNACWLCPLRPLWEQGKSNPEIKLYNCPCEDFMKSPWILWRNAEYYENEIRKESAKQIADFCEELLEYDRENQ